MKGRTWVLFLGTVVILGLGLSGWLQHGRMPTANTYASQTINREIKNKHWATLKRWMGSDTKLLTQLKQSGGVDFVANMKELELGDNVMFGILNKKNVSITVKLVHHRVGFLGLYDQYSISKIKRY